MTAGTSSGYLRLHSDAISTGAAALERQPHEPHDPGQPDSAVAQPPAQPPAASEPGWGYPPGYVPPAPPPPMPERPGPVTAAAVILIALGVIVALFGALSLFAGAVFPSVADSPEFREQFGDVSEALGGLFLVVGVIVLAYGMMEVLTGIFALSGRAWSRISGLIVAVLGILFSLLGVLPGEDGAGVSFVFVALLAAYGYVAWVLASRGWWFSR